MGSDKTALNFYNRSIFYYKLSPSISNYTALRSIKLFTMSSRFTSSSSVGSKHMNFYKSFAMIISKQISNSRANCYNSILTGFTIDVAKGCLKPFLNSLYAFPNDYPELNYLIANLAYFYVFPSKFKLTYYRMSSSTIF